MTTTCYEQPSQTFPTSVEHERRWSELAAAIAAERDAIGEASTATTTGELTIIGSGIEAAGFTAYDEILLRDADEVFYCVADPATAVWLKALRPDAYDLYVLYDESKVRYVTYMQMTEAMLHFVRKGRRVVGVYYGHPGIFVLSTHRAVQIARREGHRAVMRAAVSALDTLCADLGIDPSQPGMQTFEATDMLIRRRRPDASVHLVLWQVGLVGELGYRRQGFFNRGFSLLLDHLEELYGADHEVVNYTGSRYAGIDPAIHEHTISSLRDPAVQEKVTAISTFYLPPKEAPPADPLLLEQLGLIAPGQTPKPVPGPIREIARYGARETKAFDDYERFRIPEAYHWQEDTPAARFLLALREDPQLRARYERDAPAAVAGWREAGLGSREAALLARRDAGSAQIAAKGRPGAPDRENERLLRALLSRKSLSRDLLRGVRRAGPGDGRDGLAAWSAEHGFAPNVDRMRADLDSVLRTSLAPWSGLYVAADRELSVVLLGRHGRAAQDHVYVDGRRIVRARYERGILHWRSADGNATSGHLRTDMSARGARRLVGMIWPAGESPATHRRVIATGHPLPVGTSAAAAGAYRVRDASGRLVDVMLAPAPDVAGGLAMQARIDGEIADVPLELRGNGFELGDLHVPLSSATRNGSMPSHLAGRYALRVGSRRGTRLVTLELGARSLTFDGQVPADVDCHHGTIRWTAGPPRLEEGSLTGVLDPITLRPMLFGQGRAAAGATALAFAGMVPVGDAERAALAASPRLGISPLAWAHLVDVAAGASATGGVFVWHGWESAVVTLRMVRAALREALS